MLWFSYVFRIVWWCTKFQFYTFYFDQAPLQICVQIRDMVIMYLLKKRFTSTEHRKPNKNCWNFLILSIYKCQIIFLIRNKTVFILFGISGSSVPIGTLCICPALVQEFSSASILSFICTDQNWWRDRSVLWRCKRGRPAVCLSVQMEEESGRGEDWLRCS